MKRHVLVILLLLSASFSAYSAEKITYLLGVDGLSLESFQLAQQRGLFKEFKNLTGHISPFPSMTDLSWASIMKTPELFGRAGRIRSVEAVYFDESRKTVEGDPRDVYRRMAQPKYYLGGFDHIFNPYIEALMYFPTRELARVEIESVLKDMAADPNPTLVTGYIGGIDSTAHTQLERLYPVLQILDEQLSKFIANQKANAQANGHEVEVILVSDHGNVGAFKEGEKERELVSVDIEPILKLAGLNFSQKLESANDVAVPLMALGTWAPVYLGDKQNASKIVDLFSQYPWFDFAVEVVERSTDEVKISVRGSRGHAYVHLKNGVYYYEVVKGNPLEIQPEFVSGGGHWVALTANKVERATRQTNYPDSLIRLVQAASFKHFDFPDMILCLKDGYYINNALGEMTKMYRTHGSLTAKSSLGIVATLGIPLEEPLRAEQVLKAMGLKPETLFGKTLALAKKSPQETIEEARVLKGIPTGHSNFSQKRIFQQMTKVIANSRPYFVVDEIKKFLSAFSPGGSSNQVLSQFHAVNPSQLQAKPLVDPNEIGEITDIVIKNPDITVLQNNQKIIDLQQKFGFNQSGPSSPSAQRLQAVGTKRAAMKLYQIPYLLDQSLVLQERAMLPDTRDLKFAEYWLENAEKLSESPARLSAQPGNLLNWLPWREKTQAPSIAQNLFNQIYEEKILEDRIYPEPLNAIYKSVPKKATVVYVPGTYNGIFDREIFSLGLLSLEEDLGLRVLRAPILSACNSEYNGDVLLKFLKDDQQKYLDRKEAPPKYILLGYSKGGVDALYSFIKDTEFIKRNILGLVAIAAPLKGSQVLEKSDLPFMLVNMLIEEDTPQICQKEKTIVSTGSIQAMNNFWRKNEQKLIGLTRYFSMSFVSKPEDSHLFMKITKVMGQFDEDNDGIVALSSTKFSPRLNAVDLGVVEGDHLAGILSSRFPQKAFMRALVTTLSELGIEDEALKEKIKYQSIINAAPKSADTTYKIGRMTVPRTDRNSKNLVYQDAYDLNKLILGTQVDPAANYEPQVKLSSNQLGFDPYAPLDVTKMVDILSAKKVFPSLPSNFKKGIDFSFNHDNVLFYRMDHELAYESRSPVGADNNPNWGFQAVEGNDKSKWLALRSDKNSIRLTTLSYRFKVTDFSLMDLVLKVNQGPNGADPVKGGNGKDDSAFQVWFTLRDLRGVTERSLVDKDNVKVYFFGYYWGEDTPDRKAGQIFENHYSNKNVVITTLPESYQVLLNDKGKLKEWATYRQNIAEDIKKAFPKLDVNQLEVVAVTFQMDSNDTGTKTEAFMKTLRFLPSTQQ